MSFDDSAQHLCTDFELCPDCGLCAGGCCDCGDDER